MMMPPRFPLPRSDLPLDQDAARGLLPWVVGFMVYMAILALAGAMAVDGGVARWEAQAAGILTIEVAAPAKGGAEASEIRVNAAADLLRQHQGVDVVRVLSVAEITALLEPWLGTAVKGADLPLPRLIDVTLDAADPPDLDSLAAELAKAVPGTTLDDHKLWMAGLIRLARWLELLAAIVVALTIAVTGAMIVFATRSGMAVHRHVVELLHLMGAGDAYIARQFGLHAMSLGLQGGLVGLALAVPTLLGIGWMASRVDAGSVLGLGISGLEWAVLAVLPALASAAAMLTARLTVLRSLARMP